MTVERAGAASSGAVGPEAPPTSPKLFLVFARIGLTSFGGGLSGWMMREFVVERRWIDEEEFLNGLGIAQALPGVNVTNLAIWLGYRLRGWRGAVAGVLGIVMPPALLIVAIAALFGRLDGYPLTHPALDGAAAAAVGLSLSMAIAVMRRVPRRAFPLLVTLATFLAVGVLHWPLVWVVLGAGSVSVGAAALRGARS